ncbi:hypothetical protein FKG94_13490 [Exilibacterium tricleocarpae]|uniref:Uncharacterized protein n=1 Tax=Exilibacterium tricleocarpae TaxID=2591008 RepID=A0A545TLJ5_9GAMM|nr:DUF6572 domain-containing protein [Exilibacterium tricleocarpae]TQV78089.1 hypothetical protein FKG94_13490 [Exilibacterium tricleocarpae]
MTVSQLDVIDFIAQKPDTNEIYFNIVDHLAWNSKGHIDALKQKFDNYVEYISSDALTEAYPEADKKNKVIELLYVTEPNAYALDAISQLGKISQDKGIRFSHRLVR